MFWAILGAQLVVPVVQLGGSRPARFGWQMFSGVGHPAEFEVETTRGTVREIDVDSLLARPRPEMNLPETLPMRLCERLPEAQLVRTRLLVGVPRDVETRCR